MEENLSAFCSSYMYQYVSQVSWPWDERFRTKAEGFLFMIKIFFIWKVSVKIVEVENVLFFLWNYSFLLLSSVL